MKQKPPTTVQRNHITFNTAQSFENNNPVKKSLFAWLIYNTHMSTVLDVHFYFVLIEKKTHNFYDFICIKLVLVFTICFLSAESQSHFVLANKYILISTQMANEIV